MKTFLTPAQTTRTAITEALREMRGRVNPEDLFVKECLCGPAPIMKRFLPRAQGRATPILKRSCHITIIVGAKAGALERHHAAVSAAASGTAPVKAGKTAGKTAGAAKSGAAKKSGATKNSGTAKAAPKKAAAKSAGATTKKTAGKKTAKASA